MSGLSMRTYPYKRGSGAKACRCITIPMITGEAFQPFYMIVISAGQDANRVEFYTRQLENLRFPFGVVHWLVVRLKLEFEASYKK